MFVLYMFSQYPMDENKLFCIKTVNNTITFSLEKKTEKNNAKKQHSEKTKGIRNKQKHNKKYPFSGHFDVNLYLSQMWQCSK